MKKIFRYILIGGVIIFWWWFVWIWIGGYQDKLCNDKFLKIQKENPDKELVYAGCEPTDNSQVNVFYTIK